MLGVSDHDLRHHDTSKQTINNSPHGCPQLRRDVANAPSDFVAPLPKRATFSVVRVLQADPQIHPWVSRPRRLVLGGGLDHREMHLAARAHFGCVVPFLFVRGHLLVDPHRRCNTRHGADRRISAYCIPRQAPKTRRRREPRLCDEPRQHRLISAVVHFSPAQYVLALALLYALPLPQKRDAPSTSAAAPTVEHFAFAADTRAQSAGRMRRLLCVTTDEDVVMAPHATRHLCSNGPRHLRTRHKTPNVTNVAATNRDDRGT